GSTWRKVFQIPQPAPGLGGPGDQKISFDDTGRLLIAELGLFPIQNFVFRQTGLADDPLTVGMAYGDDQPHLDVDNTAGGCADQVYSPFLDFGVPNPRSSVSNSVDRGVTMIDVAVGNNAAFPNRTTRIAVAPNGSVFIVYKTREGAVAGGFENAHFRVNRSDDCGATWNAIGAGGVSVHGAAAVQTWFTNNFGNPAKGKVARARSSDTWIAADPGDGDVYVVYTHRDASGFGQIFVVRSIDGGVIWGAPVRVTDANNHSAFPEIAVAQTGAVGVLYVDFDDSGPSTIFRHRFSRSFDDGATWTDQVLQAMDPTPFANARDGFLWGDYEGLTAQGNTFYGVFTGASIGRSVDQLDPIFFSETASPAAPQIQVPGPLDLGDVCAGSSGTARLDVCNTGKADLSVDSIVSSNPDFSVTTPSAGYPVTVSPDFCFPFQVRFGPTGPGPGSATLTISSNDPDNPALDVAVAGNGTEPDIRVTGSTDFGTTSAWRPAERTISVCNVGSCDLEVAAAALACTDFALVHDPFPVTLPAGSCLDFVVRFEPSLPGAQSCALTVTSDDPGSPVVNRTLKARTPPLFSLHAGLVEPHGSLKATNKHGSTLNLDFVYPFLPNWAWDVRLGLSRFDGRAGLPDVDLANLSANARFTVNPAAAVRFVVNGGLGLYHFDPGDFEAGANLGLGLSVPAGSRFAFEATYNYHSAFTASPSLELSQFQLGFLVSF
ncbi:MAG: choice-of-anchor D domain-containing protein, partial [Thermoanaerobaculia bacterium]